MKGIAFLIVLALCGSNSMAQKFDSTERSSDSVELLAMQCYKFNNDITCYQKPRAFSFVTKVPKTISNAFKESVSSRRVTALSAITLSTLILIRFDQDITNGAQQLSNHINLKRDIVYTNVIGFNMGSRYVPVYQAPQNVNTALYALGEGFTSVVIGGTMFVYGKIRHDNRSLQTASQIIQSQLAVGMITQAIKRVSGRESPRVSTESGGAWRPFVNFRDFQDHTSRYDAFPSGHLASMVAAMTVLTSNYPEKRWLKPVAFGLTCIVGYAMVNNGVHWAGDYPLALGIGYVCGKASVNMNRMINPETKFRRKQKA